MEITMLKNTEPQLTKVAMRTKLSEDPSNWPSEIVNEVYNQIPELSGKELEVRLIRVNSETKSGIGVVKMAEMKKNAADLNIPVVIKTSELYPLDIIFIDGQPIPASKSDLSKHLFNPSTFKEITPLDKNVLNKALPDQMFPFNLPFDVIDSTTQKKFASYMRPEDYDISIDRVKSNKFRSKYLKSSLNKFEREDLAKIAEERKTNNLPEAFDAFILYKHAEGGSGIGIVTSPFNIYKLDMTPEMLKSASDNRVFDDTDTVMLGGGSGVLLPGELYSRTGMINIPTAGMGILFGEVVDFNGTARPESIFISQGKAAYQEKLAGIPIEGNIDLNDQITPGNGIFYFNSEGKTLSTVPVKVLGYRGNEIECQLFNGDIIKIAMGKNIRGPVRVGEGAYILPGNSKFIKIAEFNRIPEVPIEALMEKNRVSIEYTDGNYSFSGPGIGEKELGPVPKLIAQAILLGLGANPIQVNSITKTAESLSKAVIYSENTFTFSDSDNIDYTDRYEALQKIASAISPDEEFLNAIAIISKYSRDKEEQELIKRAQELAPEAVVDELLSLNFVTTDNMIIFLEELPSLKKTASTLSGMLLASRLGMSQIPDVALESSIRNIMKVIDSLDMIRTGIQANRAG